MSSTQQDTTSADKQLDLFEMPPPGLARVSNAEDFSPKPWSPKEQGEAMYMAAQELVELTSYLKLNDWQKSVLWPHLKTLLGKMKEADSDHRKWFELGYIISALEIEQLRTRSNSLEICKKYGIEL